MDEPLESQERVDRLVEAVEAEDVLGVLKALAAVGQEELDDDHLIIKYSALQTAVSRSTLSLRLILQLLLLRGADSRHYGWFTSAFDRATANGNSEALELGEGGQERIHPCARAARDVGRGSRAPLAELIGSGNAMEDSGFVEGEVKVESELWPEEAGATMDELGAVKLEEGSEGRDPMQELDVHAGEASPTGGGRASRDSSIEIIEADDLRAHPCLKHRPRGIPSATSVATTQTSPPNSEPPPRPYATPLSTEASPFDLPRRPSPSPPPLVALILSDISPQTTRRAVFEFLMKYDVQPASAIDLLAASRFRQSGSRFARFMVAGEGEVKRAMRLLKGQKLEGNRVYLEKDTKRSAWKVPEDEEPADDEENGVVSLSTFGTRAPPSRADLVKHALVFDVANSPDWETTNPP